MKFLIVYNSLWHIFKFAFFFPQLEIPKQLFDANVFNAWMILLLSILERPVPLEGQPTDPDLRKSWGWWKLKKWTVHILNRLFTRLVRVHQLISIFWLLIFYFFWWSMSSISQVWRFKASKTREQSFCPDVSKELCWENFRVPFKIVECNTCGWISSW